MKEKNILTRLTTLLVLISFVVSTSGCRSVRRVVGKGHRVTRLDQAGSAHIAVLSVGHWDDYATALQPQFKMTEDQALGQVVQTTRAMEEAFIDTLSVALGIAPPTSSKSSTRSSETVDGDTTTTVTSVSERGPGSVEGLEIPSPEGPETAGLATELEGELGIDPMTRHWAATALYQEVQLLNRYVRYAQKREGYEPYVIRLQISLLPAARNEPYDAYSTLSFFDNELELGPGSGQPSPEQEAVNAAMSYLQTRALDDRGEKAPPQTEEVARQITAGVNPLVIPLLVTDNLEASLHSQAFSTIRQFGLALALMVKGFGGSAQIAKGIEELEKTVGRDLNSLLTLARVSPNTLRVRLGALQQVSAPYAMVPRTHNITFLLLVPEETTSIRVRARTDFSDAITGVPLPHRPNKALSESLGTLATSYKQFGLELERIGCSGIAHLSELVLKNLGPEFATEVRKCMNGTAGFPIDRLWVDLASLSAGSAYSASQFELPRRQPQFFYDQAALVLDDPKTGTATVTLQGGRSLRDWDLEGALVAYGKTGQRYTLAAAAIAVAGEGRTATFRFPSLAKWGIEPQPGKGCLIVRYEDAVISPLKPSSFPDCPSAAEKSPYQPLVYRKKTSTATSKPPFTLAAGAKFLTFDKDGKGTFDVTLKPADPKKPPGKITLTVAGAQLDPSTTAGPCLEAPGKPSVVNLARACTVTIGLKNLTPVSIVEISASTKVAGKTVRHDPVTVQAVKP